MAKRKKPAAGAIDTESWMMSYADMITVLLAMFIALSTLGKDQTGIKMHRTLESLKSYHSLLGLPGFFAHSDKAIQLSAAAPRFLTEQAEHEKDVGQDKNDPGPMQDIEQEQWQRFLEEMHRAFRVDKMPQVIGQASVDFYDPIPKAPPLLKGKASEVVSQVLAMLARPDYQVQVVVWATMPNDSAWLRAAQQAQKLAEEIAQAGQLDSAARARLVPLGQPWYFANFQRPVFSLVISRTTAQ